MFPKLRRDDGVEQDRVEQQHTSSFVKEEEVYAGPVYSSVPAICWFHWKHPQPVVLAHQDCYDIDREILCCVMAAACANTWLQTQTAFASYLLVMLPDFHTRVRDILKYQKRCFKGDVLEGPSDVDTEAWVFVKQPPAGSRIWLAWQASHFDVGAQVNTTVALMALAELLGTELRRSDCKEVLGKAGTLANGSRRVKFQQVLAARGRLWHRLNTGGQHVRAGV